MITRILSGLVMAIIALAAIFYLPELYFNIAALLLMLWAAWEWSSLIILHHAWQRWCYVVGFLLFTIVSLFGLAWLVLIAAIWWLIVIVLLMTTLKRSRLMQARIFRGIVGYVVLGAAWLSLVLLHHAPIAVFYVVLVVALADSGAYFAGRFLGKHKLAPMISPKKTWEGLAGGIILAIIGGACVFPFLPAALQLKGPFWWGVISIIVAVLSVYGDLFESLLKRHVGAKDSSQLLPGHGGILDRIDGLVAALPFMFIAVFVAYGVLF